MPLESSATDGLRERNKREKLVRIRNAARELFSTKGFEATTAREVCQRAGIGNGTLFLYARDKRELLFLVFADDARRLMQEAMAGAREDLPICDALMGFFGAFIGAYARNSEFARVVAGEFFYRTREPAAMNELTREFLDCLATLVTRARAKGELRTDVPVLDQATAYFAHYAFHVQMWLGEAASHREETERALRRALQLQTDGLASSAPRSVSRRPAHRSGHRER
jgi:AcrR family transcriptional regulator